MYVHVKTISVTKLVGNVEKTIYTIRNLYGFGPVSHGPVREQEVKAAAASGTGRRHQRKHRCDMLIIEKHGLRGLPLPCLQSRNVRARAVTVANPDVLDASSLEWLWDTIAKPVFDKPGLTTSTGATVGLAVGGLPLGLSPSFPSMRQAPGTLLCWTGLSQSCTPLSKHSYKVARRRSKAINR